MLKNTISLLLVMYIVSYNSIYAGCGSCNVSKTKVADGHTNHELVSKLSNDGVVSGFVLASCGMCNFGMRNKDCSLAIQISDKAYNVKGTDIDDHGDSHAKDGFCNAIRVAKVSGKVKKNMFLADSFELQKH